MSVQMGTPLTTPPPLPPGWSPDPAGTTGATDHDVGRQGGYEVSLRAGGSTRRSYPEGKTGRETHGAVPEGGVARGTCKSGHWRDSQERARKVANHWLPPGRSVNDGIDKEME